MKNKVSDNKLTKICLSPHPPTPQKGLKDSMKNKVSDNKLTKICLSPHPPQPPKKA